MGRGPSLPKPHLARARRLRTDQTVPEAIVWKMLRAKRLNGSKFSRQVPIGPYIADFAARSAKLVVELDGRTHELAYDQHRDAFMADLGYKILRFTNSEVSTNLDGIATSIAHELRARAEGQ